MVNNITDAKIIWRGMVATYLRMEDRFDQLAHTPPTKVGTGEVLEARGLLMQAQTIVEKAGAAFEKQFPDYEFDLVRNYVRRKP